MYLIFPILCLNTQEDYLCDFVFHPSFLERNYPNHTAIVIEQIDDIPQKCYNNYNKNAIGGSVIQFLDGVPNANIYETPKDSIGINKQNLILDLPNGLYEIKKQYNDGSILQNTVLKNND